MRVRGTLINHAERVWSVTAKTGVAGNEADVITDFNRAAGDRIGVRAVNANEAGSRCESGRAADDGGQDTRRPPPRSLA
jgi:hypothetical protein